MTVAGDLASRIRFRCQAHPGGRAVFACFSLHTSNACLRVMRVQGLGDMKALPYHGRSFCRRAPALVFGELVPVVTGGDDLSRRLSKSSRSLLSWRKRSPRGPCCFPSARARRGAGEAKPGPPEEFTQGDGCHSHKGIHPRSSEQAARQAGACPAARGRGRTPGFLESPRVRSPRGP